MADFGISGLPADVPGGTRIERWRNLLELLPPAFTTVWRSDHFQLGDADGWEGGTELVSLAALFPDVRFGHLVLGQSYRNPALLAKMAATLQDLTGGRYILGLGGGWHQ